MNRNLLLVIEATIAKEYAYKHICTSLGLNLKCEDVYCGDCLMNTAPIYVGDYSNLIIQVRDITYEQSTNGNT
jgi:hypothetical protein